MREFNDKALFLGPQAENIDKVKDELCRVLDSHAGWRRAFHHEDSYVVTADDRASDSYREFFEEIRDAVHEITQKLQGGVPFFSPRYIGHMNADLLIPAVIAYFAAMLYNPNNVTGESSPVTTELEIICGIQLAGLVGYIEQKTVRDAIRRIEGSLEDGKSREEGCHTWGHLTSGGTAANIEAMWVARNLKYFPLAVKAACVELGISFPLSIDGAREEITNLDDWTLLNMAPEEVLGLRNTVLEAAHDRSGEEVVDERLRAKSVASRGVGAFPKGVIIVAGTGHYSVPKLADVLGIGGGQVRRIPVDGHFRIDVQELDKELVRCRKERVPVIAVISAFGSTEEGAVDDHHAIHKIREDFSVQRDPVRFYWHCDAAYGGYALSVFQSPPGENAMPESLLTKFADDLLAGRHSWSDDKRDSIRRSLYRWLQELGRSALVLKETDSVTIDPHKWGYVPYPCGAIVFKRREVRDLISVHAPYIFHGHGAEETKFIGRFILEGSKPGAAAAACYLAHRMLPLDQKGYGKLVTKTMYCAKKLYLGLKELPLNGFRLVPLNDPDLNIVCFAINQEGNQSLRVMNAINQLLYESLSPTRAFEEHKPTGVQPFFVSKTDLEIEAYGASQPSCPALDTYLDKLRIAEGQLGRFSALEVRQLVADSRVTVIRCTMMGPWLLEEAQRGRGKTFLDLFLDTLGRVVNSADFLRNVELRKALVGLEPKLARFRTPVIVLFADDHPEETDKVIAVLKTLLGSRIEIRQANSPLDAMEMLRDSAIELAVLDVDFPNNPLGGVDSIFRYIRLGRTGDREKAIPCLLYTHFDEGDNEFRKIKDLVVEIGPGRYCLLSKRDYAPDIVVKNICTLLTWRLEEIDG